ncbi:hypothetical protein BT67DRAFT_163607 [Trichocladium antarcticum]|uniref:Uncharacterized protein n=1 Tax=Trichocladium antarcticum TaxID=1450529 RepID=A0AAN6UEG6_9PEZI|nr:hypothetical protein BT67DRAFT_163607 [Trichocladium antarcticum]
MSAGTAGWTLAVASSNHPFTWTTESTRRALAQRPCSRPRRPTFRSGVLVRMAMVCICCVHEGRQPSSSRQAACHGPGCGPCADLARLPVAARGGMLSRPAHGLSGGLLQLTLGERRQHKTAGAAAAACSRHTVLDLAARLGDGGIGLAFHVEAAQNACGWCQLTSREPHRPSCREARAAMPDRLNFSPASMLRSCARECPMAAGES